MTVQRVLVWLLMCPSDETLNKWNKIAHLIFSLAIFLSNFWCVMVHLVYFMKFSTIDLEKSLYAAMYSIFISGIVFITIFMIAFRQKISNLLKTLSNMYHSSKCSS